MSERYKERISRLKSVLNNEQSEINLDILRSCCSYGIPDCYRPLCWRLLLGYLPEKRYEWRSLLKKQRGIYNSLIEDTIIHPGQTPLKSTEESFNDHPLNLTPGSEWNSYFKDNEVLAQIDKDVRRLCPEIDFFQRITPYPHVSAANLNLSRRITQECLPSKVSASTHFSMGSFIALPIKKSDKEYSNDVDENVEYHWQVVERILFIYSKLNSGVKYVQGMNEIVGPLYYVFATDEKAEWAEGAEADTYYCFQLLMSEIKDNFIKTLDNSNCGIESLMFRFHNRLRSIDTELYDHLVHLSIKPQFYSFRWLSLLLSQEFSLPDVIYIWDSLFASLDREEFLYNFCLAMLESVRDELINSDFSKCLKMLQNYSGSDVGQLVVVAHDLKNGLIQASRGSVKRGANDHPKTASIPIAKFTNAFSSVLKSLTKK